MSHYLTEFTKSLIKFQKLNVTVTERFKKNKGLTNQFFQMITDGGIIENPYWNSLDTKTRAEFRAVDLDYQFLRHIYPELMKNVDLCMSMHLNNKDTVQQAAKTNSLKDKANHITPIEVFKAIEALDGIVEKYLSDSYQERGALDYVLDFLKNCTNFLIKLLTFGANKSFFDTTTGRLEQTKAYHENLKSIYSKLTEAEQSVQLLVTDKGVQLPEEEIAINPRSALI